MDWDVVDIFIIKCIFINLKKYLSLIIIVFDW